MLGGFFSPKRIIVLWRAASASIGPFSVQESDVNYNSRRIVLSRDTLCDNHSHEKEGALFVSGAYG